MSVLEQDYVTTLDLLAGWDPQWDPEAIKVNRVLCMKRENLIQLIQDNVEAKSTVNRIIRQLVKDQAVTPVHMTSKMIDGEKVNIQVHEILPKGVEKARKQYP
jgi:hypothetical protein